jgi:glyoxylase-like metal-dependent hydrolase (beta-lactamase superfamily II)
MKIHKLVFSPIEVNTYILEDSSVCAVIDCGCYDKREFAEFEKFLELRNLRPTLLLNTHCHLDHIFGNNFMLEKYGLSALSGEQDEKNRIDAVQHAQLFGLAMDMPPEPESFIKDNQKILFGSIEIIALHVPGHSPGSMAFYIENENCVFTGDALFQGTIGRTDLPGGDFNTLISSIKTKLFVLPDSTTVYPGHGDNTDIKTEKKSNPYFSD